ncbi:MAG TPA: phosphoglucosamine mutase, partial [Candidatus Dormibacteraeota bacterium]|nr:phosphoglucosamine mutase [Candidatus Dormibacteraeota bacterium]
DMIVYPQVLKNIKVVNKQSVMVHPRILDEIDAVEKEMGDSGRLLVRPSGTEELVRVMAEAETEEECQRYVDRIVTVIEEIIGMKE